MQCGINTLKYHNGLKSILKDNFWFHPLLFLWKVSSISVKFSFSKKTTKFEAIFHLLWRLLTKCQIKWEIVSNFCGLFRMSALYQSSMNEPSTSTILQTLSNSLDNILEEGSLEKPDGFEIISIVFNNSPVI